MKLSSLCTHSFKSLHKELGNKPRRPIVERMRSNDSVFCRALVSNGYLTEEQMCRAAERYRLGITRDGGVIFWQIDDSQTTRDGKIMFYCPDCHRDHSRHPSWASARLKQHHLLPQDFQPRHCLFGLHLLGSVECRAQSSSVECREKSYSVECRVKSYSVECRDESVEFATAIPSGEGTLESEECSVTREPQCSCNSWSGTNTNPTNLTNNQAQHSCNSCNSCSEGNTNPTNLTNNHVQHSCNSCNSCSEANTNLTNNGVGHSCHSSNSWLKENSLATAHPCNPLLKEKTVCVVESEKSAVILSEHFPQYVWLACGGLTMLTAAMLQPLHGRKIILFPDTDPDGKAYQLWCDVAATASEALGYSVSVSPVLEQHATEEQKFRKIDLVDFLFQ